MPQPPDPNTLEERATVWGVQPLILNRWSPRAYLETPVPDQDLMGVLEAAHWAPSCFNEQPWRFIVAKAPADREKLLECLTPKNQIWARRAPVLITVISSPRFELDGRSNRWQAFDAGAAWGYLALEAAARGLIAHAMGGFSQDRVRQLYDIPEAWGIHAVIALGYRGPKGLLPADLQSQEQPSGRRPLNACWAEGRFSF